MEYLIKILEMGTAMLSPFVTMLFFFALLGVPIAFIIILSNVSHKNIFSPKNKNDSDNKKIRKKIFGKSAKGTNQ
ncbi:MAG: hypothetical protein AB8G05_23895 [Oligoflexales bacterium]